MNLWDKLLGRGQAAEETDKLRDRVAELEERLAFVNEKHRRLSEQEGVPMHENAVLRYELQKCQRDRQVLEWHIASCRGELRLTLGLLRRLEVDRAGSEAALIDSVLGLVAEARAFGVEVEGLAELETQAKTLYREKVGRDWAMSPRDIVGLRTSALLGNFESWRDRTMQQHESPADGLAALDPDLEALRSALAGVHKALMPQADQDAATIDEPTP